MAKSADPDQLASSEANWSGSTLFAKAAYIWVQQDKGKERLHKKQNLGKKVWNKVFWILGHLPSPELVSS